MKHLNGDKLLEQHETAQKPYFIHMIRISLVRYKALDNRRQILV